MTIIRPATENDLSSLGRLGGILVRMHHEIDPKRFIAATPQTEEGYAGFLGSELDRPNVILLVAEREREVIGYIYAGIEGQDYMTLRGPAGAMHDIVVDPSSREQGVGRMLLDAAIAELRSRGVRQLVLSTAVQNSAARRLLEQAGFRQTMIEMTREIDDAP